MDSAELKDLLRETTVFSVLTDDELREFAPCFEPARYRFGETVFRAGEAADAFYLVYSGRARVLAEKSGDEITVGTLTRGNHLGEQALLTDSHREYTVRAAEDLILLRLRKTDFGRLLEAHPELRGYFAGYISEVSVRNFLKLCTVFAPLAPGEIRELLGSLEPREYAAGDAIVREGEAGDAFYILRSGALDVVKESDGGKIINRLRPGDFFGELALLTDQPRTATVVATEASSVLRLEKSEFERIVAASPKVKAAIVSVAAGYSQAALREAEAPPPPPPPPDLPPAAEQEKPGYRPRRARRFPALLQLTESDCGAACLATVLRYYRKRVSLERLRTLTGAATLYSLADAGEALGFHARRVRLPLEHVAKATLPAIAPWEGGHYVVLYESRPDGVVVADPAVGLRRLTREEFAHGWTGHLLLLEPTPRLEGVEESRSTFRRYLPHLKPYRRELAEIFLASVLLQVFNLANPIFTQVIVDRVLVRKSISMLNMLLVGMILVAVFQTLTVALRKYLMVHTSRRIDMTMAVDFCRHALSLPLRFFEEHKVGDLIKRFNDNEKIRDLLTGRGFLAILDCIMIFVYLGLMLYYNLRLTVLALGFLCGYAAVTVGMTPVLKRRNREAFRREAEAESSLVESVAGIGTLKATATERPVRWRWEGLLVKALNVRFRTAMVGVTSNSLGNLLQALNDAFLLWYGARLVIRDELTVGQLMAFIVLADNMMRPMLMLIQLWSELQEVTVGMERLNEVFDTQPEEDPARRAVIALPPIRGHIRFDNVTFRYASRGRNALENVSLEVYPGQTVALVGRSGAGKSTFAGLLLRLHHPSHGRILIDGQDLRHVSIASLRSQIGVVPQDVVLFSGTIRENIALGRPEAPLEEIVGASMLAGAHEFIAELPLGYETVIGERGQSLSGGQRQRIAIARALYRKPRILIFDEATSALDTESERAIQQNLENILKGRTTFLIAHRLSSIRNADLIVVMDNGAILETGTHYSLIEQRGLYYYLNSQQLEC